MTNRQAIRLDQVYNKMESVSHVHKGLVLHGFIARLMVEIDSNGGRVSAAAIADHLESACQATKEFLHRFPSWERAPIRACEDPDSDLALIRCNGTDQPVDIDLGEPIPPR